MKAIVFVTKLGAIKQALRSFRVRGSRSLMERYSTGSRSLMVHYSTGSRSLMARYSTLSNTSCTSFNSEGHITIPRQ